MRWCNEACLKMLKLIQADGVAWLKVGRGVMERSKKDKESGVCLDGALEVHRCIVENYAPRG